MFSEALQSFLAANQAISQRMTHPQISGEDIWSLQFCANWEGIGEIAIRAASPQDVPSLRLFLMEGLGERSRFLFAPYPYNDGLDAALGAAIQLCADHRTLLYHAWHEERIIGHFYMGHIQEPTAELGIALADQFHGLKLGHLFMSTLITAAAFNGNTAIELTTHLTNQNGFHLYQKLGFERIGQKEILVWDGSRRFEHEMIYRFA